MTNLLAILLLLETPLGADPEALEAPAAEPEGDPAIAAPPTPEPEDSERLKVAVMIDVEGDSPIGAAQLNDELAAELHATERFAPITKTELTRILTFEQTRQLLGCDSQDCFTDLGALLDAHHLIAGNLERKDDTTLQLSLKLANTRQGMVTNRLIREIPADAEELRRVARAAVRALVRPLLALSPGELAVVVSEEEAEVFLDDKLIGLSPIGSLTAAGGTHQLRVLLDGFHPIARDLRLVPNAVRVERVDLVPSQAFIRDYRSASLRQTVIGIVAAAAGAALGATGLALYINDNGQAEALSQDVVAFNTGSRSDAGMRADLEGRRHDLQTRGIVWSIMGFVGVLAAATGAYVWLMAPDLDRYAAYEQH